MSDGAGKRAAAMAAREQGQSGATGKASESMIMRDDQGHFRVGGERLLDILARAGVATPTYVYDLPAMVRAATEIGESFGDAPHLVAYAVKANSAGPIVRALARAGCGAEVGSGAELALALRCGVGPRRILMSGVAKSDAEIDEAIGTGILGIQLDAVEEVTRVAARAGALGCTAEVALRLNPGIDADTHAHIATGHDEAKFGIAIADLHRVLELFRRAPRLSLVGIGSHIGSQLARTDEYSLAATRLVELGRTCERACGRLSFLDFGGGFGIDYGDGCPAAPADFARELVRIVRGAGLEDRVAVVEPGRSLVGAHGVLVASVVSTKVTHGQRWLMIDAGMNDLLRPALYGARHRVEPLAPPTTAATAIYRVAGPVCESADDFGAWTLPDPPPTAIVIRDAGAYGYTMASHYNGRSLPTEVFVGQRGTLAVSRPGAASDWLRGRLEASDPE